MAKQKWSNMSKSHLCKLIYRSALFLSAIIYYVLFLVLGKSYKDGNILFSDIGDIPIFLILMVLIFGGEMVFRFFPTKHESIGNQKLFKVNYIPTQDKITLNVKPRKQGWARTLLVFGAWTLLNTVFGVLYFTGVFTADILVLISLAYSVCDLICIMFFCPFQAWMMKNKCCTTCRIYNWDYPMMFTPLLFLLAKPKPVLHYVLLGAALAVLLIWEISYKKHPERFAENTNDRLACKNCNEKLCRHNKLFPCKSALEKSNEAITNTKESSFINK